MEEVTLSNNIMHYRGTDYSLQSYEKIDDLCVHIFLDEGIYALVAECKINNQICTTADEIITKLNENV
jgi:hypothetical protein